MDARRKFKEGPTSRSRGYGPGRAMHTPIAQQTDDARAAFINALNHEIRTPLTSVRGFAEILLNHEGDLSDEDRRMITERLALNAEKLDRLIVAWLEEKDGHTKNVQMALHDVGDLVRDTFARLDLQGRPVGIYAPSIVANVDAEMVRRIIKELIDNVLRHTPTAAPVWISVSKESAGVLLQVDDAGPGIPPTLRNVVFAPFQQVSPSTHAPGLGLGLGVVARLARAHDGRAWVEDRPGGGSSFKVLLRDCPASTSASVSASPS